MREPFDRVTVDFQTESVKRAASDDSPISFSSPFRIEGSKSVIVAGRLKVLTG